MALDIIPKQEGGKLKAVASGTLPSGQPVVVNADGTVSVAGIGAASLGSTVQFDTTNDRYISTVYDSNSNKVVIVYRDGGNSNYGTAIVGTISGASISFGSAVVFYSGNAQYISATFDSNLNKVVIAYQDVGGSVTFYGTAVVGTVSGASISFGSAVVFKSANSTHISATFDTTSNKVVIAYSGTNSTLGSAIVGTVSGTSISFGSETVWESTPYQTDLSAVYDAGSNRVIIAYRDDGDSGKGKAIVGTVSGTSISFGSKVVFEAGSTQYCKIVYDSTNNTVVIAYMDGGDSDKGKAVIGTVSGTSISFNTATVFYDTAGVSSLSASYNSNAGAVVISFRGASAYGTVIEGTTTASSITFGSPLTITTNAYSSSHSDSVYDPISKKVVIAYEDQDDSGNGKAVVYSSAATNLTSENYIGMSGGVVNSETVTQALGSDVVFNAASSTFTATTYDENAQKVVISYRDGGNSNYGTAVVGTVSGTSISFGTPVVFESAATARISTTYDSNAQKVVVVYQDQGNSNRGTAAIGTVSGTSISFGTPVVFESGDTRDTTCVYHAAEQKVVIAYKDQGNSSYGTAIVGTVSGTSISFGGASIFNAAESQYNSLSYDSANEKVVISYTDSGNSNYGTAIVGTVSGTSISFGSETVFESASTTNVSSAYDVGSGNLVVSYTDNGNSAYGTAIVGTVSGTSISFGTPVVFESASTGSKFAAYDSAAKKVVIAYQDVGNTYNGTFITGTVSDTSISFASPVVFDTGFASDISASYDSNSQKVVVGYVDYDNSIYGTSVVFQPAYTSVTRGQVASGSSATVDIVGTISTNQSGLTAGQQYYVQTDGTIGETPADPSVLAGTAISDTKLLVKI